jgi:hypothetical protein
MSVSSKADSVFGRLYKCEYCDKFCVNGYDLYVYFDREGQTFEIMHFCSTHCLSRWVGEKGRLYEFCMKGMHPVKKTKIQVYEPLREVELGIEQRTNQHAYW